MCELWGVPEQTFSLKPFLRNIQLVSVAKKLSVRTSVVVRRRRPSSSVVVRRPSSVRVYPRGLAKGRAEISTAYRVFGVENGYGASSFLNFGRLHGENIKSMTFPIQNVVVEWLARATLPVL